MREIRSDRHQQEHKQWTASGKPPQIEQSFRILMHWGLAATPWERTLRVGHGRKRRSIGPGVPSEKGKRPGGYKFSNSLSNCWRTGRFHIGDPEPEIIELFCPAREIRAHFLIRNCFGCRTGGGDHTIASEMTRSPSKASMASAPKAPAMARPLQ